VTTLYFLFLSCTDKKSPSYTLQPIERAFLQAIFESSTPSAQKKKFAARKKAPFPAPISNKLPLISEDIFLLLKLN
jgi:hypothetical protein